MPLVSIYLQLLTGLQAHWHMSPLQSQLFSLVLPVALPLAMLLAIYLSWVLAQWALAPIIKSLTRRLFRPHLVHSYKILELTFPRGSNKSHEATSHLLTHLHAQSSSLNPIWRLGLTKLRYSLEIASSKDGIRYFVRVPRSKVQSLTQSLLAYDPSLIIASSKDYWPKNDQARTTVIEMKLSSDFALPLKSHTRTANYDPLAYLLSNMAKGGTGNLSAYQLVISPIRSVTHSRVHTRLSRLRRRIASRQPLTPELTGLGDLPRLTLTALRLLIYALIQTFLFALSILMIFLPGPDKPGWTPKPAKNENAHISPSEQELAETVRHKLDQPLFETSIRLAVSSPALSQSRHRLQTLANALSPFTSYPQSLKTRPSWPGSRNRRLDRFIDRRHSPEFMRLNPVLSASELSSLYHFPHASLHPEGLAAARSRQLPAPVTPIPPERFDVVLGKSRYGGSARPIGLSLDQRRRHTYIIGKTGTGKSTIMTGAIYQDILAGNGVAVLDPHGDMYKDLLGLVPIHRQEDVVVFDPADADWPVSLNLLSPGIDFASEEDRIEWITSAVISVFQKLSDDRYWGPRMEHILRNATITALQLPNPTLYTIQQLLTKRTFRTDALSSIDDPILLGFWQDEFALMGSMQLASAIAPITQRLGQFLTSPRARNILLQPESSIQIQNIMDSSKILLVNLSKGELGEDGSRFFGTLITALIWMGAYQRSRERPQNRPDFFLYVDEFQNFATARFADIASEGRKFGLALTTAHQNVAQIKDPAVLKTITANASTIICLQASPDDEQFIIPFMQPDVAQGDITNLEPHQFFMKTSGPAMGAFSGQTMELALTPHVPTKNQVISLSRARYAKPKADVQTQQKALLTPTALKSAPERPTVRVSNKSKLAFAEMIESPPRARVKKTQK